MKKSTLKSVLFVTMAILVVGSVCLAAPDERGPRRDANRPGFGGGRGGQGGPGSRQGGSMMMIFKKLDLTEEQKEAIKDIHEQSRETLRAAEKTKNDKLAELQEAVMDGASEASIREIGAGVGLAVTNAAVAKASVHAQIKAVLTDEQLAELESIKAEMKERREQMRERFEERRGKKMDAGDTDDESETRPRRGRKGRPNREQ